MLENILKALMPFVKCIRFREIFCWDFADFFLNIDVGYENVALLKAFCELIKEKSKKI